MRLANRTILMLAPPLMLLLSALPALAQSSLDYNASGDLNYTVDSHPDRPSQYTLPWGAVFGSGTAKGSPFTATEYLSFFSSPYDFGSLEIQAYANGGDAIDVGDMSGTLLNGTIVGSTYTVNMTHVTENGIFADFQGATDAKVTVSNLQTGGSPGVYQIPFDLKVHIGPSASVVPESNALVLVGLGLLPLGFMLWPRMRQAAAKAFV